MFGFILKATLIILLFPLASSFIVCNSCNDSQLKQDMPVLMPVIISSFDLPTPAKTISDGLKPVSTAFLISLPLTQSAPMPLCFIISNILLFAFAFRA